LYYSFGVLAGIGTWNNSIAIYCNKIALENNTIANCNTIANGIVAVASSNTLLIIIILLSPLLL
jgi:hypothetical protein